MSFIEENWDISLDPSSIEENSDKAFEVKIKCCRQSILDLIKDGFTVYKHNFHGTKSQNNCEELKTIAELNKQLRVDIQNKLEEYSKQNVQYENYKKDQKLLSQGIKETHEAFLMAKKVYKKFLKIYSTVESKNETKQTIYVQFFTEAKKESENFSIRLLRDTMTGQYQLLSATPELRNMKDLQEHLLETKDVPGALCCTRQTFMSMKKTKK